MKYTFISVYNLIVVSFLGACSHNMINNKDKANKGKANKSAVDKNTEFGLIGLDGDCFVTNTNLSSDQDIFLVETINKPSVEQVKILEKIESCETIYQSVYKYSYSYTEPQYLSTKNTFLYLTQKRLLK